MAHTRGKKRTESSNKTLEENGATENVSGVTQTSDSLPLDVEQVKTVGEAINDKYEEMPGEEENEEVREVDNNVKSTVTEMDGGDKAELEQSTSEDDKLGDQEDVIWEDDEENYEEDDFVDEDEVIEEGATEEEDDDEDEVGEEGATEEEEEEDDDKVEVREEEETEEEGNEENTQEDKEIAKGDGREAEAVDGRKAKEGNREKVEVRLKNITKSSERSRKKKVVRAERLEKVDAEDKPESSRKRKVKKRVESMGMIFMCSSKTKNDCYQYRVLGLPESKKDIVEKIYTGMRLFLYDVDLKLLYGIYKAAGPGGYNIEPKAFKSQFPSQVRFTVLDDCLPLPEEKFKKVMKENYYTKSKFDCQLNSEQVKKLCKLFITSSKVNRTKKLGRSRKAEKHHPGHRERIRRPRAGDGKHIVLREEHQYHERPRKRLRKIICPVAPLRHPPAPLPSTVPSYVYERTSGAVVYNRRDPYLEHRRPLRDRQDPLLNRRDPYKDVQDPPRERHDHYRDGRDPFLERHYSYREGADPYIEHRDPYRDGRDTYVERRNPYRDGRDPYQKRHASYRDGRDSYLECRDLYRDERDPHIESRDSYRDGRDSYLERRVLYRDVTHSEPYSTYRRDPLPVHRDAYREDPVVEYRHSNRRDEVYPLSLETGNRHDIGRRDSYVVPKQDQPLLAEPIYSAEYPSRAREYRL